MGTKREIIQLGAPMLVNTHGKVVLADIKISASLVIVDITTKRRKALTLLF